MKPDHLLELIIKKKSRLDAKRPLPVELVKNLDNWFRVELTYTSNAIEGNTLSRAETALVVEKGLTVKGKTLKEHLEATNHAEALDYIMTLARKTRSFITEDTVLSIHKLILSKIDDANSGRYRSVNVRIAGVPVVMPNYPKVPTLMSEFFRWLSKTNRDNPVKIAADAHLKFVSIHPFTDGNGRTARLIMNLILIQKGYPPALIRKEDREKYIDSIAKTQMDNDPQDYYRVILEAVNRSLDIYLEALNPISKTKNDFTGKEKQLLKIGELANETGETVPTIRHWTEIGILTIEDETPKGYQLYNREMINRVKEVRRLQKNERLLLSEILNRIRKSDKF